MIFFIGKAKVFLTNPSNTSNMLGLLTTYLNDMHKFTEYEIRIFQAIVEQTLEDVEQTLEDVSDQVGWSQSVFIFENRRFNLSPNLFAMFLFNFHVPQQVALLTFGLILDTSLMVIWTTPANGLQYYTTLEVSWSKILNTTSTSRDVGSAMFSQRW